MTLTAPLYAPLDAPAGSAEWVVGAGGARLRAALFSAPHLSESGPIGSVVLSTGRAEFIEKYLEVIGELVARGFTVLAHDWRGQGLSHRLTADRLLGHADGFDDLVADHGLLLDAFESRLPKPWIALSHSMGGCLTMLALARGETRMSGCLLSAPMLGLKVGRNPMVPSLAATARLALARRYAQRGRPAPGTETFAANLLTHDPERYRRAQALVAAHPDLALGGASWGWVHSAFTAIAWLRRAPSVAGLALPVVAVTAALEDLVDNASIEALIRRLPNGRHVRIDGARHELLMETDDIRAAVLREFDALAAVLNQL